MVKAMPAAVRAPRSCPATKNSRYLSFFMTSTWSGAIARTLAFPLVIIQEFLECVGKVQTEILSRPPGTRLVRHDVARGEAGYDISDPGDLHQLADRLYADLSLTALYDLAHSRRALTGGRRNKANAATFCSTFPAVAYSITSLSPDDVSKAGASCWSTARIAPEHTTLISAALAALARRSFTTTIAFQ